MSQVGRDQIDDVRGYGLPRLHQLLCFLLDCRRSLSGGRALRLAPRLEGDTEVKLVSKCRHHAPLALLNLSQLIAAVLSDEKLVVL